MNMASLFDFVYRFDSGYVFSYIGPSSDPSIVVVAAAVVVVVAIVVGVVVYCCLHNNLFFVFMAFSLAQVWDDVGTEGRAGSIWVVNSLHLMVATVGHDPPAGPFWDLKVRSCGLGRVLYAHTELIALTARC